jgi:drug/metabolite transporter (DMT)-like permease
MDKKKLRADLLLLVTSCIWGFGFVAQRSGMEYIGPFTFNGIRFLLGSASLLPLIWYRKKLSSARYNKKALFWSSLLAGTCLFIAVSLQQLGIMFTTAGNAGFITGLYVVMVPIFGIAFGRKTGLPTWIGAAFTLIGLYFLSAEGRLGAINPGDVVMIISALFWTFHVLIIDHLMQGSLDPLMLSSGQFAWCGVFSVIAALTIETAIGEWGAKAAGADNEFSLFAWRSLARVVSDTNSDTIPFMLNALVPVLYGGLASVGIAYTLQVVAQRDAPPAHATIILCLEGCFGAIGGILILGEPFSTSTLLGFGLMLCGMLISQWEVIAHSKVV